MQNKHGYDGPMIRDFLNHLAWELRRLQSGPDNPKNGNPDIEASLRTYVRKYRTPVLIRRDILCGEGLTDEQCELCHARLKARRAQEAQVVLQALDALEDILDEALKCTELAGETGIPLREVSPRWLLTETELRP